MKAVIIAAGESRRLRPLTDDRPKCTLEINGKPIIQHQLDALRGAGIREISIIKGHMAEKRDAPGTKTYLNEDYRNNNVLVSLFHAKPEFDDELIVSYSDIVYEPWIVEGLVAAEGEFSLVADLAWEAAYEGRTEHPVEQAEKIESRDGIVRRIGKHLKPEDADSEFIGMCKIRRAGLEILTKTFHEVEQRGLDEPFQHAPSLRKAYLTDMFQELVDRGHELRVFPIRGGWVEIDTYQDFERAGGTHG